MSTIAARRSKYSIDRLSAADMLNVSTRTIDRYIRSNKLASVKRHGKVLISKEDLDVLLNKTRIDVVEEDTFDSMPDFTEVLDQEFQGNENSKTQITTIQKEKEAEIYKNLYDKLIGEFKTKSDRLENTSYRLGQLETQLKSSIPLLEHNKKEQTTKEKNISLNKDVDLYKNKVEELKDMIKKHNINQIIYIALISFLILSLPLFIILSNYGVL